MIIFLALHSEGAGTSRRTYPTNFLHTPRTTKVNLPELYMNYLRVSRLGTLRYCGGPLESNRNLPPVSPSRTFQPHGLHTSHQEASTAHSFLVLCYTLLVILPILLMIFFLYDNLCMFFFALSFPLCYCGNPDWPFPLHVLCCLDTIRLCFYILFFRLMWTFP